MKVKGLYVTCVVALGACVSIAHAAEVNITTVPGMVSNGSEYTIIAGHEGHRVSLVTDQPLAAEDSDTSLDGYLLDLDTGAIELLLPEPVSGSVTLESGNSFYPRNFSTDGTRILLAGNSNLASAAQGTAAIVFDFSTDEYIPASILDDNTSQADRPGNEVMSGNGKYVIFSNAQHLGGSDWELTWYRRDLDAGNTQVAFTQHDGTPAINQEDGRIYAISNDGNRLLGYATDGILDPDDTNGETDYFVIDVETNTASRIDAVTDEGETLDPTNVTASPDFDYLLLHLADPQVVSRIGPKIVNDRYAVHDVATGETVGLTEFLGLPERYTQIWDDTSVGSGVVFWGASSRYMVVSQGVLHLPGDGSFDPKYYVIDRDSGTGWIAGMDNTGTVHASYTHFARVNGGVLKYMAGAAGGEVSVLEHTPLLRDLALSTTTDDGEVTITLANNGENDIHNAGVSITYSSNETSTLNGTDSFIECAKAQIDSEVRVNCRVDLVSAGTSRDFTLTVEDNATLDILASLLSDKDETTTDNSASVDITKSANSDGDTGGDSGDGGDTGSSGGGGSGGGGPLTPWLIAALFFLGLVRRIIPVDRNEQTTH